MSLVDHSASKADGGAKKFVNDDLETAPQDIGNNHDHEVSPDMNWNGILSVTLAFFCVFTFGVDQNSFGGINSHEDFLWDICYKNNFGSKVSCGIDIKECGRIITNTSSKFYETCKDATSGTQCCALIRGSNKDFNLKVITVFPMLLLVGGILSSLTLAPYVSHKYGRRHSIAIGSVGIIIGSLLQSYLSYGHYAVLCLGRLILGFSSGMQIYCVPLYGSETSNSRIRGRILGLFQWFTVFAGWLFAILNNWVNADWRLWLLLPAFVSPITLVGAYFMSPSPRLVMEKQGFEAGLAVLQKVRKEDATYEARAMWKDIEASRNIELLTYREAFTKPNISTRTWTAIIMNIAQQTSGINVIINLFSSIFEQMGLNMSADMGLLILNTVFIVFVTVAVYSLDTCGGRRLQYLIGTTAMVLGTILSATGLSQNVESAVAFVGICVFAAGFQISQGILAWAYPAEIFNMHERQTTGNLSMVAQWTANIVMNFFSIYANANLIESVIIFVFTNAACLAWSWFYVEETKGKTIEEIPDVFKDTPRGHWPLKKNN